MNINPFIDLIAIVIDLYNWVLIVWIVLNWLIYFGIVNQYQPFIRKLNEILFKLTNPVLRPIRNITYKLFGNLGGIDISPIILFLLLFLIKDMLFTYFYK